MLIVHKIATISRMGLHSAELFVGLLLINIIVNISVNKSVQCVPISSQETLEQSWAPITSKEECKQRLKKTSNTIKGFRLFAINYLSSVELGALSQLDAKRCMHSETGYEDVLALLAILDQLPNLNSVCEPQFIDSLLDFRAQMIGNLRRGRIMKRRLRPSLIHFFRLLAGQVAITCKRSIIEKFRLAEEEDEQSADAIQIIDEAIRTSRWALKSQEGQEITRDLVASSALPKGFISLLMEYQPKVLQLLENLWHLELMSTNTNDERLSVGISLKNLATLEQFMHLNRACKIIDRYAQSSLYPVTRLSWYGYMAHSDEQVDLDRKLGENERVRRWYRSIQYCQAVMMLRVHVDLNQEIPIEFKQEIVNDKHFVTLNLEERPKKGTSTETTTTNNNWHRFEQIGQEIFDEFEPKLRVYTFESAEMRPGGWLVRHLGNGIHKIARYIQIRKFSSDSNGDSRAGEKENENVSNGQEDKEGEEEREEGESSIQFDRLGKHTKNPKYSTFARKFAEEATESAARIQQVPVAIAVFISIGAALLAFLAGLFAIKRRTEKANDFYW